jgi:hypothetical protein
MPIGRRFGRPGLIGTAARTAVIAGTAQATAGAVAHRQQNKWTQQQADAQAEAAAEQARFEAAAQQAAAQQAARAAGSRPAGSRAAGSRAAGSRAASRTRLPRPPVATTCSGSSSSWRSCRRPAC